MLFYLVIISFLCYNAEAQQLCRTSGITLPGENNENSSECGILSVSGSSSVAGGKSVQIEEMPWQAAVYTQRTQPFMQICGGSLVSSRVVISAAHCFWDRQQQLPAEDFAVAVGKRYRPWNDPMDDGQSSNVKEIRIPPRYHGAVTNFQDDLALLVLATPFMIGRRVQLVCLDFDYNMDRKHLTDGNLGKVGGWGRTDENGKPSPTLLVVNLPSVDVQRCFDSVDPVFRPAITSDKICAGNNTAGTAVCMGDSGGGLVFPEPTVFDGRQINRFYLRGVVSTSPNSVNDNLCNVYTYATFTHILKHEHFIREVINEASGIVPQVAKTLTSGISNIPSSSNNAPLPREQVNTNPEDTEEPNANPLSYAPGESSIINQPPLFTGQQQPPLSTDSRLPVNLFAAQQPPIPYPTGSPLPVHFEQSYPANSRPHSNPDVTIVDHKWQSGLYDYHHHKHQYPHHSEHHGSYPQGHYHHQDSYHGHGAWQDMPSNQW